jgi:hypothetical protein
MLMASGSPLWHLLRYLWETMLQLNKAQRALLADKLSDVANFAAGAWIFGQAFSDQSFSPLFAMLGVVIWCLVGWLAIRCAGGSWT